MPSIAEVNQWGAAMLPGLIGIEIVSLESGQVRAQLPLRPALLAPNGYLHAATVIALADTACGYGVMASLPAGAQSFTTIELKSNFLGTAQAGILSCTARLVHGGRTTQIWDAEVVDATKDRTVALFRCTQLLIYPRAQSET